jgi:protein-disulfide isomerase
MPINLRSALDTTATALVAVAAAAIVWAVVSGQSSATRPTQETPPRATRQAPLPAEPIALKGARFMGSDQAPLTLLVFSDFQCPYCAKFATDAMPVLRKEFVETQHLRIAFRHFPLERIHPLAMKAAQAADCAHRQTRFWTIHDLLFAHQKDLAKGSLPDWRNDAGLDVRQLEQCLAESDVASIRDDVELAKALGVTGTPTLFVGRTLKDGSLKAVERISGGSLPKLRLAISSVLAASQ